MGINSPLPVNLPAECRKAAKIIRSFVDSSNDGLDKVIPRSVMAEASGFAVFTVLKAGFLVSARAGSGIVIAKLDDRTWSAPSAIGLGGFGVGTQLGAEVTDFLIVLNSKAAVRTFMTAGSMTIGGNLSVAVGPVGRNAEGSGTVNSKGKTAALYSYSKTKGLFGGVSVEGSVIVERQDANRLAYGQDVSSKELLSGMVERPDWAGDLVDMLGRCTGMPGGRVWIDDRPGGNGGGFDGHGNLGEDEDDRRDSLDDYGGEGSPSRRRKMSGFSSPDRGGESYAFGEQGVGSLSSATSPRAEKKSSGSNNNNRSRSGSLASMFKKDLMGNEATSPFPKSRGSPTASPTLSRKGSGLKDVLEKVLPPVRSPKINAVRYTAGENDPFGEREYNDSSAGDEYESEMNPFDETKPSATSGRPRASTLDPELDLSGEVLSPWNNTRGLPSPKIQVTSTTPTGNRPRTSSTLSYSEPLDYEPRPDVRPRNSSVGQADRFDSSSIKSGQSSPGREGSPRLGGGLSLSRPKIGVMGNRSRSSSLQSIIAVMKHGPAPPTLQKDTSNSGGGDGGLAPFQANRARANSGASTPRIQSPLREVEGDNYFGGGDNDLTNRFSSLGHGGGKKLSKTNNGYSNRLTDDDGFPRRESGDALDDTDDEGDREYRQRLERLESSFRERGYDSPGADGEQEDPFEARPVMGNRSRSASAPLTPISFRPELAEAEKDGLPRAIALHDFAATHDGDLALKKGDVIVVTKGGTAREEWWTGRISRTGAEGIFPANFVEIAGVPAGVAARHNMRTAPAFEEHAFEGF